MKFLVDECVGNGVARWLQSQGYDVISVLEVSPGISDDVVLQKAVREGRILITTDKDFGDIVFRNRKLHCGIILLRLSDWQINRKIAAIEALLQKHSDALTGNFVVLTDQSIRIVQMRYWERSE